MMNAVCVLTKNEIIFGGGFCSEWLDVVIKTALYPLKWSCLYLIATVHMLFDCCGTYSWLSGAKLLSFLTSSVWPGRRLDRYEGRWRAESQKQQHSQWSEHVKWNRLLSWQNVELCCTFKLCLLFRLDLLKAFFLFIETPQGLLQLLRLKNIIEMHSWCSNITLVCSSQ